jgi:predicted nucleic acid-binding protein
VARIVLDSSVVIGLVRTGDAHHDRAVQVITAARDRGDEFVLPATVLSECLVHPLRSGEAEGLRLRDAIVGLFGPVRVLDEDVAMASVELRFVHPGIRPEDSWVIATGIVDDATVVTFDRRWAGVDPRVQVLGG